MLHVVYDLTNVGGNVIDDCVVIVDEPLGFLQGFGRSSGFGSLLGFIVQPAFPGLITFVWLLLAVGYLGKVGSRSESSPM